MIYDEDYFENGITTGKSLYENYRWIPELTIPYAVKLKDFLEIKMPDIGYNDIDILDYGCAKGYLVKAFRLLGFDAYGCDISQYALTNAPKDIKPYLRVVEYILNREDIYRWIIAKDVFEHIAYNELKRLLKKLLFIGRNMFIIVPISDYDGNFINPKYEKDPTHVTKLQYTEWGDLFWRCGWDIIGHGDAKYFKNGDEGNHYFKIRSRVLKEII